MGIESQPGSLTALSDDALGTLAVALVDLRGEVDA